MERLLALSASAGSGKTFSLVARYLSLLFGGANPSEILAITFTNKAAGEMRERVVASLESIQPEMVREISRMSGVSEEEIERRRPRVLARFLSADLKIMTIDKFVHRVLRKFCWYAGVQSDFEIAAMPKEEFFERFLQELDERSYARLVDFARFEQQKSRSFIDFFETLYEKEKELPDLTFSVEPADEEEAMRAARKIGAFFLESGVSERAKKTMRFDSLADVISKSWFPKESLNYWDYKKVYDPVVDIWLGELKEAVRRYYDSKERFFLSGIFSLYNRYRSARISHMKRAGQLYFKDIEHLVYDLLRRNDFTDFLYFRLDARIGHILFDEFQDTSVTQYRIFEPIIAEIAAGGSDRTFFYVGDTKQSIYRFRGGRKELFGYVAKRFGVKIDHLQTNYRSGSEIVEFVNSTFEYVKPPQIAHKRGGYVRVREGDEPLEMMGEALGTLFSNGVPESEIAVLVHDNKEILKVGEYVKERFGRDIATHKRAKVSEQPTAGAMIEMMRLLLCLERGEDGSLHRLNALTLAGRPYDPKFKPEVKMGRPAEMLKQMMDRYGFFDEAAMKLLEFAIPLNDLVEFVYEIERYEDELPPGEVEGINVLTIHKSKGLEFEHLIVLDRLGSSRSDTSSLIFDYSSIELKDIRVKFKNREAVDEEYARALAREKRLRDEDAMNRAYVAFTRARESLFVLKKAKSSAFGFLGLKELSAGELKYEKRVQKRPQSQPALSYTPKSYGRQECAAELEKYEPNDFEAIYLGLGVHYLLETEDEDAFLNRYGALCDTQRAKKIVQASKSNMEYLFLTEGKIFHELPFVYRGRAGVIDLFVDKGDSGVIIDYKTATPHDLSSYKEQLKRYKEALLHLMPEKKRIDTYIYFLDTQKLVKTG
ncbi:ATP-dependent DNA helicase pcrA [Hydrogenimonas sp.]|nr:ATP-dependent DNA helicase pcrA [Hydrogenimonas sp.]